jgi:hypothetical protein
VRRFEIGDRVTVREATTLFHHRTQSYTRGRTGVVVEHRPEWLIPEDEAWQREDGRVEAFYVVRFRQSDLWLDYTGLQLDTLETELAEGWLVPAEDGTQ